MITGLDWSAVSVPQQPFIPTPEPLLGLQRLIGFDSAQLLRLEPGTRPIEISRVGYAPNSAWALSHMFPSSFPTGFTQWASAKPPLPATISEGSEPVHTQFVQSKVYREYLLKEGYLDGMSVELFAGSQPIGLAHFSSRTEKRFNNEVRELVLELTGTLSQLAMTQPMVVRENDSWVTGIFDAANLKWIDSIELVANDVDFIAHLNSFAASPLTQIEHLWRVSNYMVSVNISRSPDSKQIHCALRPINPSAYFDISVAELQVLSSLCCGLSNLDIADRLFLSARTVHAHLNSLRTKTNASNRVELVVVALSTGTYIPHPKLAPIRQILRGNPTF